MLNSHQYQAMSAADGGNGCADTWWFSAKGKAFLLTTDDAQSLFSCGKAGSDVGFCGVPEKSEPPFRQRRFGFCYSASAFCQATNVRFSSENTAAARTNGLEDDFVDLLGFVDVKLSGLAQSFEVGSPERQRNQCVVSLYQSFLFVVLSYCRIKQQALPTAGD